MERNSISHMVIENYVWKVQQKIIEKHDYTYDQSYNVVYPLSYYINTGRASAQFLSDMQNVKPYVMARILVKGYEHGTVDECIAAFKKKVEKTTTGLLQKHGKRATIHIVRSYPAQKGVNHEEIGGSQRRDGK